MSADIMQPHMEVSMADRAKVTVDAEALREILLALDGQGYLIRELQVTRGPIFDNPIDRLIAEINTQASTDTPTAKGADGRNPALPVATPQQDTSNAATLREVYDAFGVGELARTSSTLMVNVRNALLFADMLHAIEREFFMVPGEPDDDYPDEEPDDVCLVKSWSSTVPEYVEQFRTALAQRSDAQGAAGQVAAPELAQDKLDAEHCAWTLDDEENGIWQSSCGEAWSFTDGGPVENRVKFCQGCGKSVAILATKVQDQKGGAA